MRKAPKIKEIRDVGPTVQRAIDTILARTQHPELTSLDGIRGTVSYVPDIKSDFVTVPNAPLAGIVSSLFAEFNEQADKHQNGLIWGGLNKHRTDDSVEELVALAYDFDDAVPRKQILKQVRRLGLTAVVHHSYSHGKTTTRIERSKINVSHLTVDAVQAWCAKTKKYATLKVKNVEVCESKVVVTHEPQEKFRVIVFCADPIQVKEGPVWRNGRATDDDGLGIDGFKALYPAAAVQIFGEDAPNWIDTACTNPAHVFFLPAKPMGSDIGHTINYIDGTLFDWRPSWRRVEADVLERRRQREQRRQEFAERNLPGLLDELQQCLFHIDAEPYDTWFRAVAAIHHETAGSGEGLELAHEWSATAHNYDDEAVDALWDNFDNADPTDPVTLGTLIFLARETNPLFRINATATSLQGLALTLEN